MSAQLSNPPRLTAPADLITDILKPATFFTPTQPPDLPTHSLASSPVTHLRCLPYHMWLALAGKSWWSLKASWLHYLGSSLQASFSNHVTPAEIEGEPAAPG